MSEFEQPHQAEVGALPDIQVGEPLPGLIADVSQLPEGKYYWDQVIPSKFGSLHYAPEQYPDGALRWVTNHGEVRILVRTRTGVVLEVDTDARDKHSSSYLDAYQMGIVEYNSLLERYRQTNP